MHVVQIKSQHTCYFNIFPIFLQMVSLEEILLIRREVLYFHYQGHCGNVKGQTMLSTHQLYSGYKNSIEVE